MSQRPVKRALSGHIVEIHVGENKRYGKILCDPYYLNIDLDGLEDVHLGDTVKVNYKCEIVSVEHLVEGPNRPEEM